MIHKIEVTQDDIMKGLPKSFTRCALATAMSRHLGKPVRVLGLSFTIDGDNNLYPLPDIAVKFGIAFDTGCVVEPFTFHVTTK